MALVAQSHLRREIRKIERERDLKQVCTEQSKELEMDFSEAITTAISQQT